MPLLAVTQVALRLADNNMEVLPSREVHIPVKDSTKHIQELVSQVKRLHRREASTHHRAASRATAKHRLRKPVQRRSQASSSLFRRPSKSASYKTSTHRTPPPSTKSRTKPPHKCQVCASDGVSQWRLAMIS